MRCSRPAIESQSSCRFGSSEQDFAFDRDDVQRRADVKGTSGLEFRESRNSLRRQSTNRTGLTKIGGIYLAQWSQPIEPFGIAMQNRVLVGIAEMLVFDDLLDLMFAVLVVDFMRKIAGKHKRLVSHGCDQMV